MAKDRNYDSYLSGYEITRAQNQVKDPATIPAINYNETGFDTCMVVYYQRTRFESGIN